MIIYGQFVLSSRDNQVSTQNLTTQQKLMKLVQDIVSQYDSETFLEEVWQFNVL